MTDTHQTPAPAFRSMVAVGDSFTEGMCDDDPSFGHDGEFAGWADRLASHLSEIARGQGLDFGYANLAVRGRKLADVVGPQLEDALALEPDLVSIVGGGNDILRPRADVDRLAVQLDGAVARLRASGADVLLCTPVDPRFAPVIRHTRSRVATVTAHINAIARERGAYVIDMWAMRVLRDGRLWSTDRIHLTPEGHARVAAEAYAALTGAQRLGAPWREPLGDDLPETDLGLRANAAWAREHAAPWVRRRLTGRSSGDTVTPKRPQWRE